MSDLHDRAHAILMEQYIEAMRPRFEKVGVEVPYEHYGNRGFIDVVLKRSGDDGREHWKVCELKPRLTDLGETIRQVKQAQRYFELARRDLFKTGDCTVEFPLVILATDDNLRTYMKFRRLLDETEVEFFHPDREALRAIRIKLEISLAMEEVCATHKPQTSPTGRAPIDPI